MKPDTILYFGHDPDDARKYISDNGYTKDTVKLVKRNDNVLVIWKGDS